jgi:hypothetical protein
MTIMPNRKLPDWWDRVADIIAGELFDGQLPPQKVTALAALLRELVKMEDILPQPSPPRKPPKGQSIEELAQRFLRNGGSVADRRKLSRAK